MAAQDRRRDARVGARAHHRDVVPVDLQSAEVDPGPGRHVLVGIEESGRARRGDVPQSPTTVHLVGPIPPVQRGLGDQGVQAGAEGHGRRHDDQCEDGSHDRRAHRHGVAAAAGFQGEPDTGDGGHRQTRVGGDARGRGSSNTQRLTPGVGATRRDANGDDHGEGEERDQRDHYAETDHRPVDVHAVGDVRAESVREDPTATAPRPQSPPRAIRRRSTRRSREVRPPRSSQVSLRAPGSRRGRRR